MCGAKRFKMFTTGELVQLHFSCELRGTMQFEWFEACSSLNRIEEGVNIQILVNFNGCNWGFAIGTIMQRYLKRARCLQHLKHRKATIVAE